MSDSTATELLQKWTSAKKNGEPWEVFTHGGRNNTGIEALEYAKKFLNKKIYGIFNSFIRNFNCSFKFCKR